MQLPEFGNAIRRDAIFGTQSAQRLNGTLQPVTGLKITLSQGICRSSGQGGFNRWRFGFQKAESEKNGVMAGVMKAGAGDGWEVV